MTAAIHHRPSQELLERLSAERPQQTPELFPSNDYYGHADILKRYVKLPKTIALKGVIEHGSRLDNTNWAVEIDAPAFIYFVWSPRRFDVVQRHANRSCYALGPMIQYVPPLRIERLKALEDTYGRNLLFFPSHSSHWVDTNYDIENMCNHLEDIGSRFQTIRVCMYWRDIQRNLHIPYEKRGFLVQCAGHIYDRLFYNRLRELIEPATITASMVPGSHIGHSLCLGKPYWHLPAPVEFITDYAQPQHNCDLNFWQSDIATVIKKLFAPQEEHINPEQLAFAVHIFGLNQHKSPSSLRIILELAEEIWTLSQQPDASQNRLLACMLLAKGLEYLHKQDRITALRLTEQAAKHAPDFAERALSQLHDSKPLQLNNPTPCRATV